MLSSLLLSTILSYTTLSATGVEITINSTAEFSKLVASINAGVQYSKTTILLTTDLDFTNTIIDPAGSDSSHYFTGIVDGQGHTISNLKISSPNEHVGLFGFAREATIKNLILDSTSSITSTGTNGGYYKVGSFFGYCLAGDGACHILNSVNFASVTFSGQFTNGYVYLGGISGHLVDGDYAPMLRNSANFGTVTFSGTTGSGPCIGGLVGFLYGTYVQNSHNYGTIVYTGTSSNTYIGGLVGGCYYGTYENDVNGGFIKVSGTGVKYTGALVGGLSYQSNLNNCYWDKSVSSTALGTKDSFSSVNNYQKYDTSFKLSKKVTAGTYSGTSLIDALNTVAEASKWGYNKWMVSKSKMSVRFNINSNKAFYEGSQLILLPGLVGVDGGKSFKGWYVNSACTTLISDYKTNTVTQFYGKYN